LVRQPLRGHVIGAYFDVRMILKQPKETTYN